MKNVLTLFILVVVLQASAQDIAKMAKDDLTSLKTEFETQKKEYSKEKELLTTMTANLNADTKEQFDKTVALKSKLDSIYKKRNTFVEFYKSKSINNDSLAKFFPDEVDFKFAEDNSDQELNPLEPKSTYFLFGDNELIKEQDLIQNKEMNQIFSKVISAKSESNLGKFEIPAVGQLIPVYYRKKVYVKDKDGKDTDKEDGDKSNKDITHFYVGFEEVNVTISEGSFEDIRVTLIDKKNNKKYYFENRLTTSLLRGTINAKDFQLKCSFVASIDTKKAYEHDDKTDECYIILKDVLQYEPNSGNNYVPDDQNIVFPIHENKVQDKGTRGVYMLTQNTSLQNTVELRTYTDFLGLFNGSANGIVQMQGKADFYMDPFRFFKKSSIYLFKKITPYVNFSKIDDDNRGLKLEQHIVSTDTTYTIKTPLELFEKSYLELGVNLNLISFKFVKEMPFKVNLYFPLRYNATSVFNDKSDNTNFKMVSYGGGLNFEFKKFSNFGFNYSLEYTNSEAINKPVKILNPDQFWVFKNEAELFYYPGESKNQSIFTRFRTFYNYEDSRDSFFQFQFGYRFTIGAGRVKSN
jgi:hypothetical protein